MRALGAVLAVALLAAGLALWRLAPAHPPRVPVPVPVPVAEPEPAPAPAPVPVHVPVRTTIDPSDPDLRAAAERLGRAVEPAIEPVAVGTVDAAMAEYARTGNVQELQARLDRLLAASPDEARRLHAHFAAGKDPTFLFVVAKLASARVEGDALAPWIESAESGDVDHRRFAMYALAGDDGERSLTALVRGFGDPSAGAAREAAGFVLEGRIDDLPDAGREDLHRQCRAELRSPDTGLRAEAVALLSSPTLGKGDVAAVVDVLLSDPDEGVRLAALRSLAVGEVVSDPAVSSALDHVIADPVAPDRLRAAARAVRETPPRR